MNRVTKATTRTAFSSFVLSAPDMWSNFFVVLLLLYISFDGIVLAQLSDISVIQLRFRRNIEGPVEYGYLTFDFDF